MNLSRGFAFTFAAQLQLLEQRTITSCTSAASVFLFSQPKSSTGSRSTPVPLPTFFTGSATITSPFEFNR